MLLHFFDVPCKMMWNDQTQSFLGNINTRQFFFLYLNTAPANLVLKQLGHLVEVQLSKLERSQIKVAHFCDTDFLFWSDVFVAVVVLKNIKREKTKTWISKGAQVKELLQCLALYQLSSFVSHIKQRFPEFWNKQTKIAVKRPSA